MQSTSRRFFHWWVMRYSKPWFPFLLVITAAGILFLSVLALYQDYWIYKPSKEWRGNPEDFGLSFYDNVCLKTKDGVAIHGWFIKQHEDYQNVPTLIYFHGTDKNHSFRLVKAFGYYINLRCNILLMTYRGFGPQSPPGRRRPSESGLYWDAQAMMEYLLSRSDLRRCFFVYGESLGGALAIYIAEKFQDYLDGLIVENTFTSLADMMTSVFPMIGIPMKWLVRNKWPCWKRIRNIRIPILFLSGLRDGFVPPKMMRTLYEEAKASSMKKLVCFQHGTHNRTWILDGYYEAWREFLDSIIHTKTTITTNHRVVPQKKEQQS